MAAVLGEATRKTDDGAIKTGFDVWVEKTTGLESITTVDAERSIFLEPGVVGWYLSRTGFTKGMTLGTVRHATRPVALCTPTCWRFVPTTSDASPGEVPRHGWDQGPSGSDDDAAGLRAATSVEHAICSSFMPAGAPDAQMDLAALVNGELRVYPFTADAELRGWMLDDAEGRVEAAHHRRHPPLDISRRAGYLEAEVGSRRARCAQPPSARSCCSKSCALRRQEHSASTSTSARAGDWWRPPSGVTRASDRAAGVS